VPTPLPVPLPTSLPVPVPTPLPVPLPTLLPVPVPTPLPVPAPTLLPVPSPTSVPSSLPTPAPVAIGGRRLTNSGGSRALLGSGIGVVDVQFDVIGSLSTLGYATSNEFYVRKHCIYVPADEVNLMYTYRVFISIFHILRCTVLCFYDNETIGGLVK
jgi:hypothetical protein